MHEWEEFLDTTTEQVLETMFYTGVLGLADALAEEPRVLAEVGFSGSHSGSIVVSTPVSTADILTAAMLGVDTSEVPEGQGPAVVGELANVLCGAILSQAEPSGRFVIAPPKVSRLAEPIMMQGVIAQRAFSIENGDLTVGLALEQTVSDAK